MGWIRTPVETVSSFAGRPLTLTESRDFAEEHSLSQLSFNHKKLLRVAAAQRLSFHLTDANMPLFRRAECDGRSIERLVIKHS
jgi:hypothetical protein